MLRHVLSPNNMVQQLLTEKKAQYGCEIVSPRTFYRELFVVQPGGDALQVLELDQADIVVEDTILHPLIISTSEVSIEVDENHGLHKFFANKIIEILQGTILADGGYHGLEHDVGKMFSKCENKELENGTYSVRQMHDPALHFRIELAPDLHKNFDLIGQEKTKIFLTGVFASALESICRSCDEEADFLEEHPRAKGLLENLGGSVEEVLEEIRGGQAAEIASHYRKIVMTPEHEN
ncbi:MAG: hypothetical protein ISN29_07885 [Gammaproteobacteria bacterium AqS3]|nr:hypothetical protein [Gammaproteobacteria bacterium AqS3]